jgi:predicted PurR-regulated permease PerM
VTTPGPVPRWILRVLTALCLVACGSMALPFLAPICWAVVLAVLLVPVQRRLERLFRHRGVAALATVALVGGMVVMPASFVVQRLVVESARGAQILQTRVASGDWRQAMDRQPRLSWAFHWLETRLDLPKAAQEGATRLAEMAGSFLKGSVVELAVLSLTFYLLFYLVRDREAVLAFLRSLSPVSPPEMTLLLRRVADTIWAIAYGTLAVSAVQGFLGGLMFWWLGLPVPLLWGVVMAVLAVVPLLGAFVIWVPTAVFLALEGDWKRALILTVWGMLVVGCSDNLLRPILVGERLRLHSLLVFISVVGGVYRFGSAGLVLGPVLLTVTAVLLEIWKARGERASGAR